MVAVDKSEAEAAFSTVPAFFVCVHFHSFLFASWAAVEVLVPSDLQAHNAQDESDFTDLRPDMLKLEKPPRGTLNQSN